MPATTTNIVTKMVNNISSNKKSLPFSKSILSGLISLFDLFVIFCAGLLILRYHPGWVPESFPVYITTIIIFAFVTIGMFFYADMYDIQNVANPKNQYKKIFLIISFNTSLIIVFAFIQNISLSYSRIWLFTWSITNIALISIGRIYIYTLVNKWAREGILTQNIAIIGANDHGSRLVKSLKCEKNPWLRVVGIFEDRASRAPDSIEGHDIKGNLDDLISYVKEKRVDNVIVALPWSAEERLLAIMNKLEELPVGIQLCSDVVAFNYLNHSYSYYGGVPVLNIFNKPMSGWGSVLKTVEDRVFSALAILVLSPVFIAIAIAIKIDSPGPVFFRQKRYGFNNKLIEILKFRSMRNDSLDANADKLVTKNDPRVTKIGSFIRKTSLDEIPQFINVLKGDMSIVGPRPHATQAKAAGILYQDHVDRYAVRHKVKPGITGWAQANGWRGETDTEEKIQKRIEYDLYYIKNWTPLFDIQIMLRTVWAVAFPPKNNH